MSSTTSLSASSRSRRPRTPLHETSNSEKNKLASGIRLVPYSPPRLSSDGESTGASHEQTTGTGRRQSHSVTEDPATSNPFERRTSRVKDELQASNPGSPLSSPTSSTTSFGWTKERGVSGTKPGPDSSGLGPSTPTPGQFRSSYGSNMSGLNADADALHDAGPTSPTPKSRRGNHIALNPDKKTFSIILRPTNNRHSDATDRSLRSPQASNYSTLTSHDDFSFDAPDDDRPISALSSLPDSSVSPYYTPASPVSTVTGEDHTAAPWNYRMVGGLRKVANTSDPTDKGKEVAADPRPLPLSPLQEVPSSPIPNSSILTAKPSFASQLSEQTESTLDENTNIKVIGESSPPDTDSEGLPEPPSSSDSNYQVFGQSSPAPPPFNSSPPRGLLDTPGSKNFVVHSGTSPATSSLPATVSGSGSRPQYSDESLVLGEKYSQESLVVPPLNTLGKKTSSERFGYYRQRSRESLRRANSFSSISSVITQDTASLVHGSTPNIVRLGRTPSVSSLQQPTWADLSNPAPLTIRMDPQPHVWSSQLSTVMSEYEGSTRNSRQLSLTSVPENRGSVDHSSRHSRQMLSISSSLLAAEDLSQDSLRSHSRSNSGQYMMRGGREGLQPTVRDLDEHGDGLADLRELNHKGSRPLLSHLNHKSSDRSLRSSVSSRAGSFTANSLPHWAKIYYGSGERKWLAPPSIRSYSDDSRPTTSFGLSGSPTEQFPPSIFSPRRRPREVNPEDRPISTEVKRFSGLQRGLKKMTSSLWSPHLEEDRRAHDRSMWQGPPIVSESGIFGPRNRQVLLFAIGFIFPFAWMIASFLSLPVKITELDMVERDHSTTQFRIPETPEPFVRQARAPDNKRYLSARWWRNLNRMMSVVGLLVVGAIVALAIVGYWQNMKTS